MPLITIKRVKEIRDYLKKKYPKIKFSVIREHHSTVRVAIMASPYEFPEPYMQLNPYEMYIKEHHAGKPYLDLLLDISKTCYTGNRTVSEDADYGSIPNFYVDIHVGKWDKKHVTIK